MIMDGLSWQPEDITLQSAVISENDCSNMIPGVLQSGLN